MNSDQIVAPVPGVFTFIGDDGKGLRDVVMALNDQWSFYMVRRVGDDAQLKGLEDTLEDVKESGVDKSTMVAVESLGIGTLHDLYPISSYTIKRSLTNHTVALEEIGSRIKATVSAIYKFIIESIKKGLAYLSDKISAVKQKIKRDKSAKLKETIEGIFNSGSYQDPGAIRKDPKLSSVAEALIENYSELVHRLGTEKAFVDAFQQLVVHVDQFSTPLLKGISLVNKAVEHALADKPLEAVRTLESIPVNNTNGHLVNFLKIIGVERGQSAADTVKSVQNKLGELHQELHSFDPYALPKVNAFVEHASQVIAGPNPRFVFDDTTLTESVLAAIKGVDELEKHLFKADRTFNDETVTHAIKRAGDKLFEEVNTLRMIIDFADQFYTILSRFTTNAAYYLERCKKVTE